MTFRHGYTPLHASLLSQRQHLWAVQQYRVHHTEDFVAVGVTSLASGTIWKAVCM